MNPSAAYAIKCVLRLPVYLVSGLRHLRNWPEFTYNVLKLGLKRPLSISKFELRNGLTLSFPPRRSTAAIYEFSEIVEQCVYTREPGFEIGCSDVVIDVGASFGLFTALAAQTAKRGKVYAFEPCTEYEAILPSNMRDNGLNNVTVSREAIAGRSGRMDFLQEHTQATEMVPCITLDDLLENEKLERCDLLKVDTEGAEYAIIEEGAINVLNRIRRITMEWHRVDNPCQPQELKDFLESSGFHVTTLGTPVSKVGYLYARRLSP